MAARPGRQPVKYKGKRLGFIIHAHCWVLFGRTIETPLIEINLERFIKALRSHWRKSKLKDLVDDKFYLTPGPNQVSPELQLGCDIHRNPVIVPVLQKVITDALNRDDFSTHPQACFDRLPAELTHLISEWVLPIEYTSDDVRNMRNMLLAFGWDLPGWFWRRRLAEDLFFELEVLRKSCFPPPAWMKLQMMRLDVMYLTFDRTWYPHSGLANRKRILESIVAIKNGLGIV
ncbi:hypothetical protein PENSUB_5596 [Penicillium subrubescens]|uniref:Uncharacterized protein n=2 Tax=Penicillium subrubescens TaxID=1316194 RepID=A0A1Q5U7Z8_9EURO|nr:hypothetical protein PENSUB_5596 [Penicillium subrubescens]